MKIRTIKKAIEIYMPRDICWVGSIRIGYNKYYFYLNYLKGDWHKDSVEFVLEEKDKPSMLRPVHERNLDPALKQVLALTGIDTAPYLVWYGKFQEGYYNKFRPTGMLEANAVLIMRAFNNGDDVRGEDFVDQIGAIDGACWWHRIFEKEPLRTDSNAGYESWILPYSAHSTAWKDKILGGSTEIPAELSDAYGDTEMEKRYNLPVAQVSARRYNLPNAITG